MSNASHERFIYSPKNLAQGLSQVSSDIVDTPSAQLEVRWYRSSYVDIQLWVNQKTKKIIRQQFSFLGLVVEWNHIQGIKTGIVEDIKSKIDGRKWSVKIIYDEKIIQSNLEQAIEVILLCDKLPERDAVLNNFRENPVLSRWQSFLLIFKHLFSKKYKKS